MASPLSETTCQTLISSVSSSISQLPASSSNGSLMQTAPPSNIARSVSCSADANSTELTLPLLRLDQLPADVQSPSQPNSLAIGAATLATAAAVPMNLVKAPSGPNLKFADESMTSDGVLEVPVQSFDQPAPSRVLPTATCSVRDGLDDESIVRAVAASADGHAIHDNYYSEMYGANQLPSGAINRANSPPQRASSLSSGKGIRRRWPSLRAKIGRLGSLRKFSSITLSGVSGAPVPTPSTVVTPAAPATSRVIPRVQFEDSGGASVPVLDAGNSGGRVGVNMEPSGTQTDAECGDLDGEFGGKQSTSSYLKEQFFSFFQPSDNKLAMKLFGNKNALLKEKRRQQQQGKWVIHPCSNFRFYWDVLMLVMLIANLIILPVAISFFNDDLSTHWILFNCVSDTVFLVDIAVNFRTGVITNDYADEIVLDPKTIAVRYVRSWFFLDLISSIPMDYIFLILNEKNGFSQLVHAGRALRILRLAKLLSLLRLLRLSRLVRYVSQWEEFLNVASKFMRIFNLVLLMLLLGHWNACLQFLIPLLRDFPANSWVKINELQFLNVASVFLRIFNLICLMILLGHWNGCFQYLVPFIQDFPSNCWVVKLGLKDKGWFEQYTWALFKAMSHMLSIGYGRYPPTSMSEAWITIVSMLTGATCYALFVGHAAALIQSFDTSKRLYREKFKQVEEYMAYRKLPRPLRQRIANYYEHRYQGKMFNEDVILFELSECLREQVVNYNCRALVAAVPFFTYADQDFVSEVVTRLKYEVFQPGDIIIKEGTIGTKMYFIQEGIVDIITKENEVATSLSDGSYFGEICLLTNARRVASVRAETYCNLYSLERDNFLAVLENYPLMRRTLESVAAERLSKIGQNPSVVSARADLKDDLSLVKEIVQSVSPMGSDIEDDCCVSPEKPKDRRKSLVSKRLLRLAHRNKHTNSNHGNNSNNSDVHQHLISNSGKDKKENETEGGECCSRRSSPDSDHDNTSHGPADSIV